MLYSNIGQNKELAEKLVQAGGNEYLKAEKIIELNHRRGKGELVHRSGKELAAKVVSTGGEIILKVTQIF